MNVNRKAKPRERSHGFRSKNLKRNQEKKLSFSLLKPTSAVGLTTEIHKVDFNFLQNCEKTDKNAIHG